MGQSTDVSVPSRQGKRRTRSSETKEPDDAQGPIAKKPKANSAPNPTPSRRTRPPVLNLGNMEEPTTRSPEPIPQLSSDKTQAAAVRQSRPATPVDDDGARILPSNVNSNLSNEEEDDTKAQKDEERLCALAKRSPTKFQQSMALERPSTVVTAINRQTVPRFTPPPQAIQKTPNATPNNPLVVARVSRASIPADPPSPSQDIQVVRASPDQFDLRSSPPAPSDLRSSPPALSDKLVEEDPYVPSDGFIAAEASRSPTPIEDAPTFSSDTNLKMPATGRMCKKSQMVTMQTVIQVVFGIMRVNVVFRKGFPDKPTSVKWAKKALLSGAKNNPNTQEMYRHMIAQPVYLTALEPIVSTRIGHYRLDFKKVSDSLVAAGYGLGHEINDEFRSKAAEELLNYTYIFCRSERGVVHRHMPYTHDIGLEVIRQVVFSDSSFVKENDHLFPSTVNPTTQEREYELTPDLVALGYTSVYASLLDKSKATSAPLVKIRKEGKKVKSEKTDFSAANFGDVYEGHLGTLGRIKDKRGDAGLHKVLHGMYKKVSSAQTPSPTPHKVAIATASIDWDAMDVDDC